MLVLTRKIQETIRIGDNIRVTIVRVKGNTVRVGIDAPREVRIVRGELTDRTNGREVVAVGGDQRFTALALPCEESQTQTLQVTQGRRPNRSAAGPDASCERDAVSAW